MIKKLSLTALLMLPVVSTYALTGKEVYEQTCIACHGPDGKGAIPGAADLTDPNGRLKQKDSVLVEHITKGFQTPGSPMAMPPKGGNDKLTDQEIKDTLKYVRETFQKKTEDKKPEDKKTDDKK